MEDFSNLNPGETRWIQGPAPYQVHQSRKLRHPDTPGALSLQYEDTVPAPDNVPQEQWLTHDHIEQIRDTLHAEVSRRGAHPDCWTFIDVERGTDSSVIYSMLLRANTEATPETVRSFWEVVADLIDPDSDAYVYGALPTPTDN